MESKKLQKNSKIALTLITLLVAFDTVLMVTLGCVVGTHYIQNTQVNYVSWLLYSLIGFACVEALIFLALLVPFLRQKIKTCLFVTINSIFIVVSTAIGIALIVLIPEQTATRDPWGPILQRVDGKLSLTWFSTLKKEHNKFKDAWGADKVGNDLSRTYIGPENISILANGSLNKTFKYVTGNLRNFAVLADTHLNGAGLKDLPFGDSELLVIAGDNTYNANTWEYIGTSELCTGYETLIGKGNHDELLTYYNQVTGRKSQNFLESYGDVIFYHIYILEYQGVRPKKSLVDEGFTFLESNLNQQNAAHRFIVVHHPVYSNGDFGTHRYFAQKMEGFMDQYAEQYNFRAVLTGHDHHFAAFERKGIFYFITSPSGGGIDNMMDSGRGERQWTSDSNEGPLQPLEQMEETYGYEYHLASKLMHSFMTVEIKETSILYSGVDADKGAIWKSFEQIFQ